MNFVQSFFYTIRDLVIAGAIAIIVPLLAHYTALVLYPEPRKAQFETAEYRANIEQNALLQKKLKRAVSADKMAIEDELDALDEQFKMERTNIDNAYEKARIPFNRLYASVLLVFAIVLFLLTMWMSILSIIVGCMISSFVCFKMAASSYWPYLGPLTKIIVLLSALILVLILALHFMKQAK